MGDMLAEFMKLYNSFNARAAADLLASQPVLVALLQLTAYCHRERAPHLREPAEAQLQRKFGFVVSELTYTLLDLDLTSQPGLKAGQLQLVQGLTGLPSRAAAQCLYSAMLLVEGMLKALRPDYPREVLVAVAEAGIMEHAGRLLLLLRTSCPPADELLVADAASRFAFAYGYGYGWDDSPVCGPCAQHAAMVVGLAAVRELEGVEDGEGGAPCPCLGRGGRHQGSVGARLCALSATLDPARTESLRPHTAARLLLRLGFAVARGADQMGGASAGAAGAASTSGSGPPLPLSQVIVSMGTMALDKVTRCLEARVPWRGPWRATAAGSWRLAAELLRRGVEDVADAAGRNALASAWKDLLWTCNSTTGSVCHLRQPGRRQRSGAAPAAVRPLRAGVVLLPRVPDGARAGRAQGGVRRGQRGRQQGGVRTIHEGGPPVWREGRAGRLRG
ncbi:hypothetical protein HYH03_010516 [Edaphochlamys debaryana]|uniref:Uncharacterized protein n=1 Tax=Edaphochlamys debaryana TaxID=47281 RepID=A0A835XVS0_9CHLO|nr:hypothetical protein HYH03_010516 [Edaphochlamys debaryana]|eukprot:KAG2491071.1 hypothetical protein HYH03_010516 [Edaphochlamys debaryana]